MAALVVVVVAFLAGLLFTAAGTRLLLTKGVPIYSDMIPGNATLGGTEGALASGVVLHGLHLEDRDGNRLVSATRLELSPDLAALLGGEIAVTRILIAGADVTADGAWVDLGPESSAPPEPEPPAPPTEGLGPSLPRIVVGALEILDSRVHLRASPEPMVAIDRLGASAQGDGHHADVELEIVAKLPPFDLEIGRLKLAAGWRDPAASVERLELETNLGSIDLQQASVDLEHMLANLGSLSVTLPRQLLHDHVPTLPEPLDLELDASARENHWMLGIRARGEDGTKLDVGIAAHLDPTQPLTASVDLTCTECLAPGLQARIDVDGTWTLASGQGNATVGVEAGPIHLDAAASMGAEKAIEASVAWTIDDLAGLEPWLRLASVEAPLSGATHGRVTCSGHMPPKPLHCNVAADMQRFAPLESASIAAKVDIAERIEIAIEKLSTAVPPYSVKLVDPPARIAIEGNHVTVEKLAITESVTGGHLDLRAAIAPEQNIQADLRAQKFRLDALEAFVPGIDLGGTLDAEVHAATQAGFLTAKAVVAGKDLAYGKNRVGDLHVDAALTPTAANGRVKFRGPIGRLNVDASAPLRVAAAGTVAFGKAPVYARVELDDVNLERIGAFVTPWEASGALSADVTLRGQLAAPIVKAEVHGRTLAWGDLDLGDFDLSCGYRRATASARLHARHPASKHIHLTAQAPVAIDLEHGRVSWQRERPHQANLVLSSVNLPEIGKIAGVETLKGWVDAELKLQGRLREPQVSLRVGAGDLGFEEHTLGSLNLEVVMQERSTSLEFDAYTPIARAVKLRAHAPIDVDLLEASPRWSEHHAYDLDLHIKDADLEEVLAWVPGVRGQGHVTVRVVGKGTPTEPRVALDVTSQGIVVEDIPIEDIDISVDATEASARADVSLMRGHAKLRARALVPLDVDLPRLQAKWEREGAHELVASVENVDAPSLAPLYPIPESVDLHARTKVAIRGNLDLYALDWTASARVQPKDVEAFDIKASARVDPKHQEVRVTLDGAKSAHVGIEVDADVDLARMPKGRVPASPIRASVSLESLELSSFANLLPATLAELTGRVEGRVDVKGTLNRPDFRGNIALRKGGITPVMLRQRFQDITLTADFDRQGFRLSELHLVSGRGSLEGEGGATFDHQGLRGKVTLEIDKLPVRVPPLPSSEFSANVETRVQVGPEETRIEVELSEPALAVLNLTSAGPAAIPTSDHVVFVDAPPPPPPPPPKTTAERSNLHASLELRDPFLVEGPTISMSWNGALTADVGEQLALNGRFSAVPGASTFDLVANEFTVQRGEITLSEDVGAEPFVDIEARTTVGNTKITATIKGRASRPEIRFTSDPPRSETEIIAILLSRSDDAQSDAESSAAQAASALAAFSSPALSQQGQKLGIDSIRLSFGDSLSDPIASFGKRMGKRLFGEATFRGNAPDDENRAEVMLRYTFLPRWFWETKYGDRQIGEIGIWWRRTFDGKLDIAKDARETLDEDREDRNASKERRKEKRKERKK